MYIFILLIGFVFIHINDKPLEHLYRYYKHLPGLQSVNREQIDNSTFEMVKAGDQLSFNISKQITP